MNRPRISGLNKALIGVFALFVGASLFSGCATPPDRAPTAEVEGVKDQTLEERLRPAIAARLSAGLGWGYVAAIREGGKTVVFASGRKTLEPPRLMVEKDRLAIGSVSKTFTGILIHLAEAEGRLKTDRTLAEIFPELKKTDAGTITLFNLGLHQSGLPSLPPIPVPDAKNPYAHLRKEGVLSALKTWKAPELPAGKVTYNREYSNWGFMTLGLVLEKVYGRSYPELVRVKILRPLGMQDTAIAQNHPAPSRRARKNDKLLSGYSLGGDLLPWWSFPGFVAATGGIESNAIDMAKFLVALETPPAGNLGRAMTLSMESGIGWDSEPGHLLNWKNGSTAANSAILIFDRAKKRGLYVGANSDLEPDDLGSYAIGKTAQDEIYARVVTKRIPSSEELTALRGHFKATSAPNADLPLKGVTIFESLGRMTARYDFGSLKQGALLLPGDKDDLWNVAEGDLNIDKVRLLGHGENVKLRLTISQRLEDGTAKTTIFDLEKEEAKPEAYPAQE